MDIQPMHTYALVTLFAPFVAAIAITCLTLKHKILSGLIANTAIAAGLVCGVLMGMHVFGGGEPIEPWEITWLEAGGIEMRFGIAVDALSVLMSLVVGIVGTAVFVYSVGYMKGDEGYSRYFACLSLFAFSMLGIVFSTNLMQTFIFWELVGVSSYSLIGYYIGKDSAVDAGKKAFLTNRIGDFGMTVGILWTFFTIVDAAPDRASFSFHEIAALYSDGTLAAYEGSLMWASLLIFTGAMAKSAQVPLHVWLPDAMEGPTPVSALMHAATMVAAGVYLVARVFFLFAPYPEAMHVIAWVGGITALSAALLAFVMNDIKKVLAYSTLSQLGYMVMALGLFGPAAAMFHLMTHAFFKGLLFLGSGSVIMGCHHEQDMRKMGGLMKKMPITGWTFWIGSLALAGIVPLAGFWSKDAILGTALHHSFPLYVIGVLVALMTACYMGRCCWMTFHGEYRGHGDPHESPISMTAPLMGLALLAVVGGFFNWPMGLGLDEGDYSKLEGLLIAPGSPSYAAGVAVEHFSFKVAAGGTAAALIGFFIAWMFYSSKKWSIDAFVARIAPIHKLLVNKYYLDDLYLWLVREVQQRVANICAFFEQHVLIEVAVNGVGACHRWAGGQVRLLLDGHLHRYVTMALLGATFILFYVIRMGN